MKTIRLGRTNLEVSRVGIGGIPIQRPPEKQAIEVIRHSARIIGEKLTVVLIKKK